MVSKFITRELSIEQKTPLRGFGLLFYQGEIHLLYIEFLKPAEQPTKDTVLTSAMIGLDVAG